MSRYPEFDELQIVARTLWGEARRAGPIGMQAVASVIRNRSQAAARYGKNRGGRAHPQFGDGSLRSACLAKFQFSCWNSGDPNLPQLLEDLDDDQHFDMTLDIAATAIEGTLPDSTKGATHYLTERFHASASPEHWSRRMQVTVCIGQHVFLK